MSSAAPGTAGLTESQAAIAEVVRAVFTNEAPLSAARDAEPLGFDTALWGHMRGIGAPALGLSESAGGLGIGFAELVVMAEEVGRAIASIPLLEHVVASRVLERVGADADLVAAVADGSLIATIAVRPAVDGTWRLVPGGAVADVVIGLDGDALVVTRATPPGEAPANHACAPLAHRSTSDGVVLTVADGRSLAEDALVEWQLLVASALVGISATALDLGVAYATERVQFGALIGTFQAVQHTLADLPGHIDGARLLVHEAAWVLDGGGDGRVDIDDDHVQHGPTLAAMAFAFATDVASMATARSLHVHGGYGFSEEYDIQLLYRRARGWPLVAGDLGGHYQRLAAALLDAEVVR